MLKTTLKVLTITTLLGGAPLVSAYAKPAPSSASATAASSNEGLDSVAWVQSSTESKIAARQAYRLAARQLDVALKDKNWTAATEQKTPYKQLPPAIILDLDETVFDNSYYYARVVRNNGVATDDGWNKWSAEANVGAIEGAVPFLKYAQSKGVNIFYISNRTKMEEAATRKNLQRLGCPVQGPEDHVLLAGEKPEWTSNKTTRRAVVARKYRVLLLMGDDMNDFISARSKTLEQRIALYNKYINNWGERWILFSNPMYGSWDDAIMGFKSGLSHEEQLRLKHGVLKYRDPAKTR